MLIFVVALPAEARPIVDRFAMKQVAREGALRVYGVADGEPDISGPDPINLVVSGVGRAAAARAVDFADGYFKGSAAPAWLNVGVCGHRDREVGSAWLTSSIEDGDSGRRWYPHPIKVEGLARHELRTVDRPESDYPDGSLYDMEASGFCEAALCASSVELVQCVKIVSDNLVEPAESVNAKKVTRLIEGRIEEITAAAAQLIDMAAEAGRSRAKPELLDRILGHWHFTQTERHQVERALRRLAALGDPGPNGIGNLLDRAAKHERGSKLLADLRDHVESLALESGLGDSAPDSEFDSQSESEPDPSPQPTEINRTSP